MDDEMTIAFLDDLLDLVSACICPGDTHKLNRLYEQIDNARETLKNSAPERQKL